jgi:hypothetical protein
MQKPRTSLEIVRVFAIAALGEGTPAERVDADIREPLAARELIILTRSCCFGRDATSWSTRNLSCAAARRGRVADSYTQSVAVHHRTSEITYGASRTTHAYDLLEIERAGNRDISSVRAVHQPQIVVRG